MRYEHPVDRGPTWYFATLAAFVYRPDETRKHPAVEGIDQADHLELRLTTDDELGGATEDEWKAWDTLVGSDGSEQLCGLLNSCSTRASGPIL